MLWPEGGENQVQNNPKNQLLPCFSSSQRSLFSLYPVASSALEDPTKTFLLHQQTASQPPHQPKSSSVISTAPTRSSLSSLQILFFCILFFFLPQPTPPEPSAEPPHHNRDPHARQLPPPCVASSFFVEAAAWIHPCMHAPPKCLDLARPFLKKNSKILWKKLWFSHIFFY